MNVYNRPLFRQAGGPAQMMPQDMAQQGMPPQGMAPQGMPPQGGSGVDPQMEQALTAAEQQSAAGMAEVGASYAESMMSGLDNAEDYKTVIDSIRGNALPMEARYSELASLVGEEDARKTPESVLTLIQPTIMMTEQGAMDSGIGELMRQVTGEIDMEAENGMPTEMGQGVGSLMTAGVGQQPTQNFSLGGPVVRMGTGGNPRLEQLSSEILGNYRNIMGDGEDQKKLTQAQILFDIADAAGRFASGTNAQGQSVAGLSPFAQLGAATSGLGGRIGERVGELDKQDRALKLSALGAAQTEYSAEQAAARAAASDKSLGKFYDIIVEGKVVATEALSTKSDVALIREMYPNAIIRESKEPTVTDANIFAIRDSEGNQKNYDLNDPKQLEAFLEDSKAPGVTSGKVPTLSGDAPKPEYETLRVAGQDKRYRVGSPEYEEALRLGGVVVGAVSGDAPKPEYETLRVAGQDKRYRVGSPEYEEALRLGGVVVGTVSGDAPKPEYETLRVAGQDKRYRVGSPEYEEALRLGGVVVGTVSGDAPKPEYETLRVAGQDKRYRVGSPEYEEALRLGGVVVGTVSGDAPKPEYETLRVAGQDKRYRVGSPEYEEALRLGGVVVGAVSGDAPKPEYETLRVAGQDKRYRVGSPEYEEALRLGGVVVGAVSGERERKARTADTVFTDSNLLTNIKNDTASEAEVQEFLTAVASKSGMSYNPLNGTTERQKLPDHIQELVSLYNTRNGSSIGVQNRLSDAGIPSFNVATAAKNPMAAYGTTATLANSLGVLLPGMLNLKPVATETGSAVADITAFNNELVSALLAGNDSEKDTVFLRKEYQKTVPDITSITTSPERAADQYYAVLNRIDRLISAQKTAVDSGTLDPKQRGEKIMSLITLRDTRLKLGYILAAANTTLNTTYNLDTDDALSAYKRPDLTAAAKRMRKSNTTKFLNNKLWSILWNKTPF
jgi:hypothetical protein